MYFISYYYVRIVLHPDSIPFQELTGHGEVNNNQKTEIHCIVTGLTAFYTSSFYCVFYYVMYKDLIMCLQHLFHLFITFRFLLQERSQQIPNIPGNVALYKNLSCRTHTLQNIKILGDDQKQTSNI